VKKKFRIGCLVVILYCLGCSLYVGISGHGYCYFVAEMATLGGGNLSTLNRIGYRVIDIVTAPAQIAFFVPLFGINYIQNHTGERGRERAEHERQRAAHARYVKLLDENFDRIYIESEFLNPTNKPAMEALYIHVSYKTDAERQQRFAEYCLEHPELMPPLREFWRLRKLPVDLQRRTLAVVLEMAKKNPSEDVKWLLWGIISVGDGDGHWTIPDEELQCYATNEVEIIRWSAQDNLKHRASYRDYLRRHEEMNGK